MLFSKTKWIQNMLSKFTIYFPPNSRKHYHKITFKVIFLAWNMNYLTSVKSSCRVASTSFHFGCAFLAVYIPLKPRVSHQLFMWFCDHFMIIYSSRYFGAKLNSTLYCKQHQSTCRQSWEDYFAKLALQLTKMAVVFKVFAFFFVLAVLFSLAETSKKHYLQSFSTIYLLLG